MKINTGGVSHIELSFETKKAILPQGVFSNVIDKTPEKFTTTSKPGASELGDPWGEG